MQVVKPERRTENSLATRLSVATCWSQTACISYFATSRAAWETSRYHLSLSTSVSVAAASTTSGGCVGSTDTIRGKRLLRPPSEDDPTPVRRRCVDRPSLNASSVGHLPGSITKAEGGRRGERGAKRSLAAI
jgi:hypothetical protein